MEVSDPVTRLQAMNPKLLRPAHGLDRFFIKCCESLFLDNDLRLLTNCDAKAKQAEALVHSKCVLLFGPNLDNFRQTLVTDFEQSKDITAIDVGDVMSFGNSGYAVMLVFFENTKIAIEARAAWDNLLVNGQHLIRACIFTLDNLDRIQSTLGANKKFWDRMESMSKECMDMEKNPPENGFQELMVNINFIYFARVFWL